MLRTLYSEYQIRSLVRPNARRTPSGIESCTLCSVQRKEPKEKPPATLSRLHRDSLAPQLPAAGPKTRFAQTIWTFLPSRYYRNSARLRCTGMQKPKIHPSGAFQCRAFWALIFTNLKGRRFIKKKSDERFLTQTT